MRTVLLSAVLLASLSLSAQIAPKESYLDDVKAEMTRQWPGNRTVNIVFHGHSVPAGYFVTPDVRTLEAYPHLVLQGVKVAYPHAVVNCIVTAIGGESSLKGSARFEAEVLCHRPDILFIDYALNDRKSGIEASMNAWEEMVVKALSAGIRVILMTPTPDTMENILDDTALLAQHSEQIRALAQRYRTGLVDSYQRFKSLAGARENLSEYMAQNNHPNAKGHRVVAELIAEFFK